MTTFYSNGKLLLTAEYVVLDGALALALPSKFGQSLTVETISKKQNIWESYDADDSTWFKAIFNVTDFDFIVDKPSALSAKIARQLQLILQSARKLNPLFLKDEKVLRITTKLSFPRFWGLGSSSTLINDISQWAQVDAYKLQFKCFGGSGYDIACAQQNQPILYQLKNQKPNVKTIDFNPDFKEELYFVYLNQKQNSREGIARYKQQKGNITTAVSKITDISQAFATCNRLSDFDNLITQHETIIGKLINIKPIKEQLFKDYFGAVKSLGAWGGDFILATGNTETPHYFKEKGFKIIIKYDDMVL